MYEVELQYGTDEDPLYLYPISTTYTTLIYYPYILPHIFLSAPWAEHTEKIINIAIVMYTGIQASMELRLYKVLHET